MNYRKNPDGPCPLSGRLRPLNDKFFKSYLPGASHKVKSGPLCGQGHSPLWPQRLRAHLCAATPRFFAILPKAPNKIGTSPGIFFQNLSCRQLWAFLRHVQAQSSPEPRNIPDLDGHFLKTHVFRLSFQENLVKRMGCVSDFLSASVGRFSSASSAEIEPLSIIAAPFNVTLVPASRYCNPRCATVMSRYSGPRQIQGARGRKELAEAI